MVFTHLETNPIGPIQEFFVYKNRYFMRAWGGGGGVGGQSSLMNAHIYLLCLFESIIISARVTTLIYIYVSDLKHTYLI